MKVLRQRKYLFALLALLVVFAACKGESPTAPTPTGGTSGGGTSGGTTPPVGATITLTVSNASPLVNSTSVVTATVSANGNPVPNGTAVEFDTTLGQWTDTVSTVTIRTTTNGVATATLTSPSADTAKVTAIVNNVSKTTNIVFQAATTPPTNTPTAPTVTGVSPATGLATGGETITITGTNFRAPVRVLFDFGGGVIKEGFVANVTPTQLTVVTPKVDLGAGQTLAATIIVINEAGTTTEARVSASAPFTFRLSQLTPVITTVSPDSGGIEGGTRITIFGSGFE
ncbi:MAG TPA: IPT/TIG domain-containing protein, partial [Thermoanaerobaculia bacterium]